VIVSSRAPSRAGNRDEGAAGQNRFGSANSAKPVPPGLGRPEDLVRCFGGMNPAFFTTWPRRVKDVCRNVKVGVNLLERRRPLQ